MISETIQQIIDQIEQIQTRLLSMSYKCYNNHMKRPIIDLPNGGVTPEIYIRCNMWIYFNVSPCLTDTNIYMNGFAGNPDNQDDHERIRDIAKWFHTTQEYMEQFVILYATLLPETTYTGRVQPNILQINRCNAAALNCKLTNIRIYRSLIDKMISQHTTAECRRSTDIQEELQLLSRMNRLPEAIVDTIASFLPTEIDFHMQVLSPTELFPILQGVHITYLRKLFAHFRARYYLLEDAHLFSIGILYSLISRDLTGYFLGTEWGLRQTTKEECIRDIISLYKLYHYVHNIYLYKLRHPDSSVTSIIRVDAMLLRDEITYTSKLVKYVSNIGKKPVCKAFAVRGTDIEIETLQPIPITRQYNTPNYVTYTKEELVANRWTFFGMGINTH